MNLTVGILSGVQHQTLAAFLSHVDCSVVAYPKLSIFLGEVLNDDLDLLFVESTALKSEEDYHFIRRILNQKKDGGPRLYFLDESLKNQKLSHVGTLSPEDFNAVKRILEETKSLKVNAIELDSGDEHALDEEVIHLLDEENIDEKSEKFLASMESLFEASSIDELGLSLTKGLGAIVEKGRRGVFFKYLPTYCSLVALSSFHFGKTKTNGMGLNFSNSKDFNAHLHLHRLQVVPAFIAVVERVFGHKNVSVKVLEAAGEVRGVLVYEKAAQGSRDYNLQSLFKFASVKLEAILFRHKYRLNKRFDELTSCVLRDGFFELLQNEIIRARRVHLPVSLMMFEIDGFYGVKAKYNPERVKILLKSFAKILKENIRHNDVVGLMAESRFAIIFPHMSSFDANFKAKKMMKLISQTKFFNDMKTRLVCTTSVAIGTYPSQISSADELVVALETALAHRESSGTLHEIKAKPGFVKDFEELKLP